MIDYLVVGSGLAGISFCRVLRENRKTFLLYDDGVQQASTVAAGVYNPVVLKRLTAVWKAKEQLAAAIPFYNSAERDLSVSIHHKIPVHRKFASVEEQNLWFEATGKSTLQDFLSPVLIKNENPQLHAPFSLGRVRYTGRIAVAALQAGFRKQLRENKQLINATLEHKALKIAPGSITCGDIRARHIVFCEGYGMRANPLFRYLPLQGTKGELITIEAPQLRLHTIVKASVFVIPVGNDRYKVGATYTRGDATPGVTPAARAELLVGLKSLLKCPFEVVGQEAGIRPTVPDRRPLAGTHPVYDNVHILNGLGSRGVLMAPFAARRLYHSIEDRIPLYEAMDIKRYEKQYFSAENTLK